MAEKEGSGLKEEASRALEEVVPNYSDGFLRGFYPVRLYLVCLGKFPFRISKEKRGTNYMRYSGCWSLPFFFTSLLHLVCFVMLFIGFFTYLFAKKVSKMVDRCGLPWETWIIHKMKMWLIRDLSWVLICFMASYDLLRNGNVLVHYFNYWNRAVRVLQMDVTKGRRHGVKTIIFHALTAILLVCLFLSDQVPSLQDSCGALGNFFTRLFIADVYRLSGNMSSSCDSHFLTRFNPYTGIQFLGLMVKLLSMCGAMTYMLLFAFFCSILRNGVSVWNERLRRTLDHEEGGTGEEARRGGLRLLLKDHLILVQLFKMTETVFGSHLQIFFITQVLNLVMQFYQWVDVGGKSACEVYMIILERNGQCVNGSYLTTLMAGEKFLEFVCKTSYDGSPLDPVIDFGLLAQTIILLFGTTFTAAGAYEEAAKGFGIVRRHGFLFCRSRAERNFIYNMVVSFAHNNPMHISAGGYFAVNRAVLFGVIMAMLNMFVLLEQFRQAGWKMEDTCNISTSPAP